jgi:hypothetical protein
MTIFIHYELQNIIWGNTVYNINVSKIKKNITGITAGCWSGDSCRASFTTLTVTPVQSQHTYIFSSFIFG